MWSAQRHTHRLQRHGGRANTLPPLNRPEHRLLRQSQASVVDPVGKPSLALVAPEEARVVAGLGRDDEV